MTIGADAGGSIRLPAAFCGVVGLKPTWGRVSRFGLMGFGGWFDAVGPIAATVGDCAAALEVIAGRDRNDPRSSRIPVGDYSRIGQRGVRGLKIGILKELMAAPFLQDEVRDLVSDVATAFNTLGANVTTVSIPQIELASTAQTVIAEPAAAAHYRPYVLARAAEIDVFPRCRLITAMLIPGAFRARAIRYVEHLRARIGEALKSVDVLLSPTTIAGASTVPKARIRSKEEAWLTVFGGRSAFTSPFSLTGNPALSVPCGFTREGLPIAFQLVGRHYEEATALRAGVMYQSITDWHRRHPAHGA